MPVGIRADYRSGMHSSIINDKKNKTPTPGWMFFIRQDAGKEIIYGKYFNIDGSIEEGDMDRDGTMIKGFRWELKDDETHDKFKVTNGKRGAFISNE